MKLGVGEIERINAYGPFNHSVWSGKGVTVTNEEVLEGRAAFLARTIRKAILKRWENKELATKTIADVGAYDGWILHQLQDLSFREMVAIEPRLKNIEKGKKIRKILGIKTRLKFVQAAIETLPKKKYDVVMCIGTLHHVESIPHSLRKLDEICKGTLIIGTLCLPETHETSEFMRDIEMKDIIYKFKPAHAGLTGHKFESSYYDGSAVNTTVVSVPSINTLLMYLDVLGYDATIVARPEDFRRAMPCNPRPSREVLISARKRKGSESETLGVKIAAYERGFVERILPRAIAEPLYEHYCLKKSGTLAGVALAISAHIENVAIPLPKLNVHNDALDIIRALQFNPFEKIALEYGKVLIAEKRYREAVEVLRSITQKPNADWRAAYRAFHLLSRLYATLGDKKQSAYYRELCEASNSDFATAMKLC